MPLNALKKEYDLIHREGLDIGALHESISQEIHAVLPKAWSCCCWSVWPFRCSQSGWPALIWPGQEFQHPACQRLSCGWPVLLPVHITVSYKCSCACICACGVGALSLSNTDSYLRACSRGRLEKCSRTSHIHRAITPSCHRFLLSQQAHDSTDRHCERCES